MHEKRVFVTRRRVPEAIELLERHFDVDVWEKPSPPDKSVVLRKVSQCEGMRTEIDDILDKEVLRASTTLRVIANRAVGMDNVDVDEATRCGIAVANTPGVLHESCADFTFALILSAARRVAFADRRVREGAWKAFDQSPYMGLDVHGATLGIVGLGQIGSAVARRAKGFDMRVVYFSRTRKPAYEKQHGLEWMADLASLLSESDFVSLHVPLTAETTKLISDEELGKMKPNAILINTTRGPTVDLKALYNALSRGLIAGAGLDVTDPEPISLDDPLLSLPNVVITPHISSASSVTVRNMGILAAQNIVACLTGQPMPLCVNPDALLKTAK